MSIKRIIQTSLMLAAAVCVLQSQDDAVAGGNLLDQTGHSCCPVCDHVCKLEAKQVEEEKSCYKVETKAICIPRVVFPWQKARKAACDSCDACDGIGCTACVHNGARVRKVCVLKTEKYTCPACEYKWTAEKKCNTGCCSSGPACGGCDAGCDSGCASQGAVYMPAPPQPVATQPVASTQADSRSFSAQRLIEAADYYRQPGDAVGLPIPTPSVN